MNEDFYTKSEQLGRKYLYLNEEIKNYKNDIARAKEIRNMIQRLEDSLQKFSESSTMRSRIEEQIEQLNEQIKKIEGVKEEFKATKQKLLELTATSFEIDPKEERKLSKDYIQAVTHLLLGVSKDHFEFHECTITPEGIDVVNYEVRAIMVCANICDFVREAANKKLGKDTKLKELWDHISGSEKMFKVFSILAKQGTTMNAKEISSIIGDPEWNPTKVKNDLNNLLLDHLFIHKLIQRVERGKYRVSDIGLFLWQEYGPSEQQEADKLISTKPQIVLNKWQK